MIYEKHDDEFPHQLIFNIENEKQFFKACDTNFSMNVYVEMDEESKNIDIDKDKFEYICKIKEDLMDWLSRNTESNMFSINTNLNSGKTVVIAFKEISDLILFKLSCL